MAQDFLGSIAQEDVQFLTQILRTFTPGDNFWKLMMFIEETRFVDDPDSFIQIPGTTLRVATVTSDTYSSVVNGLARSWLFDFFASGTTSEAYLVMCAPDVTADTGDFITGMEAAYDVLKGYAYWKTACAGAADAVDPTIAIALATKCADDAQLLSGPPLFPITTLDPANVETSDPLYVAFKTNGKVDAVFTAHQDATRNGSLFRLGQAMSFINASGTCVGNNFDYVATSLITASGEVGNSLPIAVRNMFKDLNIGFFKLVGNSSGDVAAVGVVSLLGRNMQAYWIVAYINYMCKVNVATFITQPNRMRNAASYATILAILSTQLNRFGPSGSQRLVNTVISAPAFADLPPSKGDEIIIPNAWSANYTDQVHTVTVYGTLTIAA
jgi:hypothetical protein